MRHIPEDELHAYLDQGLSRSQCVEIESHLAGCSSCRANARRDRRASRPDHRAALPRSRRRAAFRRRSRPSVAVAARAGPHPAPPPARRGLGREPRGGGRTRAGCASSMRPGPGRNVGAAAARRADRVAASAKSHAAEPHAGRSTPARPPQRRSQPAAAARSEPGQVAAVRRGRRAAGARRTRSAPRSSRCSIRPRRSSSAPLDEPPARTPASSSTACGARSRGTARRARPASDCRTSTGCRCSRCRSRPASRASGRSWSWPSSSRRVR